MINPDVLIIGGGAAGLAAAHELAAQGLEVCILEARDRLGGRIWTRHEADAGIPIELGAEFIHGHAPAVMRWLAYSRSSVIDAAQEHWRMTRGRLEPSDALFTRMRRELQKAGAPPKDVPFSVYLDEVAHHKLSPEVRRFARTLVEGFDAADATRVSTREILAEWSGATAADAATFRPLGGYRQLIQALHQSLDTQRVCLRLSSVVNAVEWTRGEVVITAVRNGAAAQYRAARAVVTVPLGVLQASVQASDAIRFVPALQSKQLALSQLAFGPVIKIVMRFDEPFWERVDDGRLRNAAFLHASELPFPTFWSPLPVRAPVLNAWAAGSYAAELRERDPSAWVDSALESLQILFGKRTRPRSHLVAAHVHDWQRDPYARGAYSYVLAGGSNARKHLARPMRDTLFFAGEACDVSGSAATVAGALESGRRAAMQILKQLGRRRAARRRGRVMQ